MSTRGFVLLTLLTSLASVSTGAQEARTFPIERFRLSMDENGILGAESGSVAPHLQWSVGLWAGYADNPFVARDPLADDARVGSLVRRRVGSSVVASLGLFDLGELGLEIPVALYQSNTPIDGAAIPTQGLTFGGLGDVRVMPKFALLKAKRFGFDLALVPGFTVPSSTAEAYLGDTFLTFAPELLASTEFGRFRMVGNLGYRFRRETQVANLTVGNELFFHLAGAWRLNESLDRPLEAQLALAGATSGISPFQSIAQTPVELLAGANWRVLPQMALFAAAGGGVAAGFGSPDWRVLAGVRWTAGRPKPVVDTDGDGLLDPDDACPNEPGPVENKGCPDTDRDGDGIVDRLDACPDDAGPVENQGCPDSDRDGDGVVDRLDNCPDEFGPAENQGCPLLTKQMAAIAPTEIKILEAVHFEVDRWEIRPETRPVLDSVAQVLRNHDHLELVVVEGHTCSLGPASWNETLSKLRAQAVLQYLVAKGIDAARLRSEGLGASQPMESNDTLEGRAQNRRVIFRIERKGPSVPARR